jgi:hypothetical protein
MLYFLRNTNCRLLVIAMLVLVALGQSSVAWSAPPQGPVFVCQNGVCIFNPSAADTDGDGFSDVDERLAGTNPRDPKSHPSVLKLIKIWHKGVPGLRTSPFREVIVLPVTAPNGTTIGRSPIPALPGRKDALAALGLTAPFLGGRDVSNGLRAVLNLRTPSTKLPATMRVSGIDIRLISDDDQIYGVTHSEEGGEVTEWFDKKTGEKVGQDTTVHGEGGCTTSQTCNKSECITSTVCPRGTVMTDPDADPGIMQSGAVLVATPAQIAAYNLKRGTNTNFGSTGVKIDPSAPPLVNNKAPIILVNPDDDSVWVSTQATAGVPTNFNRFGGNVNGGRPDGPDRPPVPDLR